MHDVCTHYLPISLRLKMSALSHGSSLHLAGPQIFADPVNTSRTFWVFKYMYIYTQIHAEYIYYTL